ncbi:hypothetical protein HXX76_009054 [Chlamydomonas incerta]|uniref:C2 domain-containing protein n=1 Tax=Chlamydomonas incerta TaxID=51695 RepID=A0A835SS43_CHLIN|nr:hypothetical protein HXX76_009054 [Chlamydomonas incerta]|eukprot:KAG2432128.1 hypothetical protein HXX76_009054 [Chlamydomonas incerta]
MAHHPGVLTATVEFAQGLKDKLLVRRQDPYCIIRIGGQTVRTRTACGGGCNPVWNETFSFDVHHANELDITIKDDKLLHNPTLGTACVSLTRARELGADHLTAEVICPHHHCQHGAISLALVFRPHAHAVAATTPAYPAPPPPTAVQGVPVHALPPPPSPPPATVVMPVPVYTAPLPPRVVVVDACVPLHHHHGHHHHHGFHHHHHHHGHHHHHHWC